MERSLGKTMSKAKWEFAVFHKDENAETAEFNRVQITFMQEIKAIWRPVNEKDECWASWLIELDDIPHEHFDIMEDGELFCRGAIFSCSLTSI